MTFRELQGQVKSELKHIEDWPQDYQSELRARYTLCRQRSLGKKAAGNLSAGDVLRECLARVRADHPDAVLKFDAEFFGIEVPACV